MTTRPTTALKPNNGAASLPTLLRSLRLAGFLDAHADVAETAEREGWAFADYLAHLCEHEVDQRQRRRIARLRKQSGLPPEKSLATLDLDRLPARVRRQLPTLCQGDFVDRAENCLAFGLPGRGKTHALCAVAHALVEAGHSVLFTPAFKLVQRLLVAKRDLALEKELQRLDRFEAILIDDIGYVQQSQQEMEVLFTFLAERYERRTVMITSNLVFSQWDRIFKDTMTTACAIDRLVHHATILEMTGTSYRTAIAKKRKSPHAPSPPKDAQSPKQKGKKGTSASKTAR